MKRISTLTVQYTYGRTPMAQVMQELVRKVLHKEVTFKEASHAENHNSVQGQRDCPAK